jgi:hypothetical protein
MLEKKGRIHRKQRGIRASREPLCCTYAPVQGTTHIESVSPQVGLPGVALVYVQGYCFGDTKGIGSIILNCEPMIDIVFWTDAEIEWCDAERRTDSCRMRAPSQT